MTNIPTTSSNCSYKGTVSSQYALVTVSFKHGIPPGIYDKRLIDGLSSIGAYQGMYIVYEMTRADIPHLHIFVTFKNVVRDATRTEALSIIREITQPHNIDNMEMHAYNIKPIKTTSPDDAIAYLFKNPTEGYPIMHGKCPMKVLNKLRTKYAKNEFKDKVKDTIIQTEKIKNCSVQACLIFIREFMKKHEITIEITTREFNRKEFKSVDDFLTFVNDNFDLYGTYSPFAINEVMKVVKTSNLGNVFPTHVVNLKYIQFKDCMWNVYSGEKESLDDHTDTIPTYTSKDPFPTQEFFATLEESLLSSTCFTSEELEEFRKEYGSATRPWVEGNKANYWFGASGSGKSTLTLPLREVFNIKIVDFTSEFSYSQIENGKSVAIMNEFSPYERLDDTILLKLLEGESTDVPVKHKTPKQVDPINVIAISNVIPPVPIHPKEDPSINSKIELIYALIKERNPEGDHPQELINELKQDVRFGKSKSILRDTISEEYAKEEILKMWFSRELMKYTEIHRMNRRIKHHQFAKSIENPSSDAYKFFAKFCSEFIVWTTINNPYIDYDSMSKQEIMDRFFKKK